VVVRRTSVNRDPPVVGVPVESLGYRVPYRDIKATERTEGAGKASIID